MITQAPSDESSPHLFLTAQEALEPMSNPIADKKRPSPHPKTRPADIEDGIARRTAQTYAATRQALGLLTLEELIAMNLALLQETFPSPSHIYYSRAAGLSLSEPHQTTLEALRHEAPKEITRRELKKP